MTGTMRAFSETTTADSASLGVRLSVPATARMACLRMVTALVEISLWGELMSAESFSSERL